MATKREPSLKNEASRAKVERRSDLQRAIQLSLEAQQRASVKAEPRTVLKAEPRVNVKEELRSNVKAEARVAVKAERGAAASDSHVTTTGEKLPPLKAKVEQLRKLGISRIKTELLRQETQESGVADLYKRGLAMRAKEQKVKKEQGVRKKNRFGGPKLLKVKKERKLRLDGRPFKKRRITKKGREVRREVMAREVTLSQELGGLLGADALSRPETVRRLWAYCKDNGMLNPENKREILFDTKLEAMMGTKKAGMCEMISLLMPHFDYSVPVVKQEAKQELGRSAKVEPKKEKQQSTKHEQPASTKHELLVKRAKTEPSHMAREQVSQVAVEQALRATALQITSFDKTSVVVCCEAPPGQSPLEAVACSANGAEIKVSCAVDFREDRHGDLKPHAEARLAGLDPKHEYRIRVRLAGVRDACRSHETLLPQRAQPSKWSARDVTAWCQAQHVPELVHMAQEYAIDGKTLLTLREEDLKASGIAAPFLLRRTLTGIAALRAGGS